LMIAVTSTIAVGSVFDVVLGLPPTVAILIAGGVVVAYSTLGGMWSITLTDFLQFCVMTVGIFLILLPLSIARVGGFSGMAGELPGSYFDPFSIGGQTIFTYFLLFFFGLMIGQDIWQRVFTARSPAVARWGGVVAGFYCLLYGLAGALIGTAARVLIPDLPNSDNAFARVAAEVLPTGVLGLVLAAALAAVMSTASAGLLASSTILANDVYAGLFARRGSEGHAGAGEYNASRISTLLVGVVVLAISVVVGDVVGALTVAYNLLVGALFVPIIGALFWRRATGVAALASMLVGGVVVVGLMISQGLLANSPIYVGLLTSLIVFVVVSFITPQTSSETMSAWDRRIGGEGAGSRHA
nr:sodium:solute symporter [Rubrobacter sp.]